MIRGSGYWSYDPEVRAWYFGLSERAAPPYRKQVFFEAIVDLDDDGRLAGIEFLGGSGENAIEPPLSIFPGDGVGPHRT